MEVGGDDAMMLVSIQESKQRQKRKDPEVLEPEEDSKEESQLKQDPNMKFESAMAEYPEGQRKKKKKKKKKRTLEQAEIENLEEEAADLDN